MVFVENAYIFIIAYSLISCESILDYFLRLLMVGNNNEVDVNTLLTDFILKVFVKQTNENTTVC